MKLLFLLLTLICCFSFVGSKNHLNLKHAKATSGQVYWEVDNTERDTKEKFQLQLIPLVHDFLFVPEAIISFVYPTHSFTFSFHTIVAIEICSQGPPAV